MRNLQLPHPYGSCSFLLEFHSLVGNQYIPAPLQMEEFSEAAKTLSLLSHSNSGLSSLSIASRARNILDRTVPMGQSITSAISS